MKRQSMWCKDKWVCVFVMEYTGTKYNMEIVGSMYAVCYYVNMRTYM